MSRAKGAAAASVSRSLWPPIGLAFLVFALVAISLFMGETGGLAATLSPLVVLGLAALLGTLLLTRSRLARQVDEASSRVTSALAAVPEDGVAPVAGLTEPGVFAGVIREISTLLADHAEVSSGDRSARETAVRTRLETVLRDLHDGVLICTLDHQLLMYNRRALELLGRGGEATLAEGVGLDRSLFETLSPRTFRHALGRLMARHARGRHVDHADGLSVPLMGGTVNGRIIIRGRMSLMLDDAGDEPIGYVVTFDDVTNSLSQALWRERAFFDLQGDLKARLKGLKEQPQTETLADEVSALAQEIDRLDALLLDVLGSAWPMSAVFSSTLFSCVADRNSEDRALTFDVEGDPVWLHCDSAAITDLIDRLANRVAVQEGIYYFRLIATLAQDGEAYVELMYEGQPIADPMLAEWLEEPLDADLGAVTGTDVLHRHRTAVGSSAINERISRLRLTLRVAAERYDRTERSFAPAEARAEFYDFDLLHRPHASELDATPLSALTCVVFDTETTGLEPSKGDEIISIGAARIVNGRLLRGEIFNEFVNPGRSIPAASTKIHGITSAMVADAPSALETLPRFHRYVGPAALIAHNAAFDMKFLALKESAVGVRFSQPVLDTLLLAAHALGRDETLSLDGLSERFGITLPPEDRHTALGDALATGEVFLRLLPILETKGVRTLGDALAASDRQVGLRRMQEQF
ncbi:MAG: PAS domain-containing protein [Devosiaceae bacterium]|nr:PAS domain-containing protein [Devosiaceae bacterium MH13]